MATLATTFNEVILFKWVITNETTLAWAVVKLNSHFQRIPVLIKSLDVIKQVNLSIYKILNIHLTILFWAQKFWNGTEILPKVKKIEPQKFFLLEFSRKFCEILQKIRNFANKTKPIFFLPNIKNFWLSGIFLLFVLYRPSTNLEILQVLKLIYS